MESVIEVISVITGKGNGNLSPSTSLRSLGITSSIEILKIQSALERRFNQKLPPLGDSWTIDKIATEVGLSNGSSANGSSNRNGSTDSSVQARSATLPSHAQEYSIAIHSVGFFIGIDIEEVDSLPVTSNYRSHEFYQGIFSDAEISYALLKPEPRIHLCGMFCAKEALKKSAVELIQLRMDEIQVHHRQGRPFIDTVHSSINSRFAFQVSISHSNHYAVATVLAIAK